MALIALATASAKSTRAAREGMGPVLTTLPALRKGGWCRGGVIVV